MNQPLEAAIRAHQSGRLHEAAQLYRHVLSYDPDNRTALSNSGLVLGMLGEYAEAETLLRRVMSKAPDHATAYENLSVVLHAQQRFDEAIACCEAGLKVARGNRKLLNTMASSLTGAGRYDEAIALLTRIVTEHPRFAEGYFYIGSIHARLGRCDEAVACFDRATAIDPRDGLSFASAGECLLVAGRAREALDQLERALGINGYDVNALALKTLALAELGRTDDERWLADPHRLVRTHRLADTGYSADEVAAFNRRLSAFASNEQSLREDPPEYATARAWHSTANLAALGNPVIDELQRFIRHGFEERLRSLAAEDPAHPFVRSAPRNYSLDMWAVKMTEGGGKMLPHIHTDGWLSAVYYIDVPSIANDPAAGQAAWIEFGSPRADIHLTRATITRRLKPEPGLMATFPSYIWHDTVPLPPGNTEQRLCIAFDLQPAR